RASIPSSARGARSFFRPPGRHAEGPPVSVRHARHQRRGRPVFGPEPPGCIPPERGRLQPGLPVAVPGRGRRPRLHRPGPGHAAPGVREDVLGLRAEPERGDVRGGQAPARRGVPCGRREARQAGGEPVNLNHLNLTVTDVQETYRFLEKYFGMEGKGGNNNITFLTDGNGMILTLTSMKLGGVAEVTYPPNFHIGFAQPDAEAVNAIHRRLRDDGYD